MDDRPLLELQNFGHTMHEHRVTVCVKSMLLTYVLFIVTYVLYIPENVLHMEGICHITQGTFEKRVTNISRIVNQYFLHNS